MNKSVCIKYCLLKTRLLSTTIFMMNSSAVWHHYNGFSVLVFIKGAVRR